MTKRPQAHPTIPCACGGHLMPGHAGRFDASTVLGLPIVVEGHVPGLVCDECSAFAPTGALLNSIVTAVAVHLLTGPRQLSGTEFRFLRRNLLACTQEELAQRLSVSRRTLIRWEDLVSLSSEADFMTRGIFTPALLDRVGKESRVREIVADALRAARRKGAPKRLPKIRLESTELLAAG